MTELEDAASAWQMEKVFCVRETCGKAKPPLRTGERLGNRALRRFSSFARSRSS